MIAVTLRQSIRTESGYFERWEPLASAKIFLRNFLLVWNWEKSQANLQDQAGDETSAEINTLVPEYLKTASNKAARLCDVALALGDSEECGGAEKRLQEAIEGCERAFGKENPYTLAGIEGLALIYKTQKQWTKAEDLFWQVIQTRKRVQGMDHPDTLSSIANLVSSYVKQKYSSAGKPEITSLMDRIRDNVQIAEDMVQVATSFGKGLVTLLLDLNIPITTEAVEAAAKNGRFGKEVLALVLDQRGDKVKITKEVVKAAAGNECSGKEVIELLLNQRGDEVKITEEVVKAAAGNECSGKEVIALLPNQRGDEVKITEEVVKAAAGNEYSGKEVITLLLDQRSDEVKITEEVVKVAATSGQEEVLSLLDQWDSIGSDKDRWLNISRLYNAAKNGDVATVRQLVANGIPPDKRNIRGVTPLWRASERGHKKVVEVLLATSAVEVNVRSISGQTPLFCAAAYGRSEVVRLLLDHGAEANYTDKDGRSPLSIAQLHGQATVVAMLTRHESTMQDKGAKKAAAGSRKRKLVVDIQGRARRKRGSGP